MKVSAILFRPANLRVVLAVFMTLAVVHGRCEGATPPPVPSNFQDLYNQLEGDLNSFNVTLNSGWNGSTYPVLYTGDLDTANANSGPQMLAPSYMVGLQLELQGLKAMGFTAVYMEVGFPMLYEPFFSSQTEYQEYVNFYSQVASTVRAAGMKLVVENDTLWASPGIWQGWNVAPFFASLSWSQYQQARAETAVVVAQTIQPDYLVLAEEPDTEAWNTGQSEVNTVSGATSMVTLMLTSVRQAGVSGMKVGAGVGSWLPQFQQFTQSYLALPLDFMDMHIYYVNDNFLPNALTIATMAATAHRPVAMSECWLYKIRNSELNVLSYNVVWTRNYFNFWEPLDSYFLETIWKLGNYQKFQFWVPFSTANFFTDFPYDSSTENLSPEQLQTMELNQEDTAVQQGTFTPTGVNFYNVLVSPPNKTAPTAPTNLQGFATSYSTITLSWNASTDKVGVAGYAVFRNGVQIGTTTSTYYQDSGLAPLTAYSYAVVAFDLGGNTSSPADVTVTTRDNVPPSPPTNVAGTAVSCKQINLSWSPATGDPPAAYLVFRGTSATTLSEVGATYASTTSLGNYPLTPGTTYYFGVETEDAYGNISSMSTVVQATTLAPPLAPQDVAAKPLSDSQISLTWLPGSSGMPIGLYNIFRGSSPSGLSQVGVNTKPSYTDYNLTPNTTYYYAVQEEDTGGDLSPLSATVSATTP